MDYKNIHCEACGKPFVSADDVVVCPDCGAPMHRSCWNELGHCAHENEHASGYSWVDPNPVAKSDPVPASASASDAEAVPANPFGMPDPGPYGGYAYGERTESGDFRHGYHRIDGDEPLGDATVKDYAEVIGKGKERYLPKFYRMDRTNSNNSWNWAAFFFPILWAAYRKMYGVALVALILTCLLPFCFMDKVVRYSQQTQKVYQEILSAPAADGENAQDVQAELMKKVPEMPTALRINQYVVLAIQVLMALFGNALYKRHVEKILMRAKTLDGEERAKLIRRKGGASWLAVALALLVSYALIWAAFEIAGAIHTDLATVIWRLSNK